MASGTGKLQAPKGTRDFYPADMAVRRYIESVWRKVSINHGFEEVDGPTFEHTDLYTVKSGPGIVSEMFGVFSGKDEAELEELKRTGRAPFALRPEFTPTLARMVAARAAELPRPIKWFCMPTFYRAERPQRGRLREFQQWNVDLLGDDSPQADAEVIATAVAAMQAFGLTPETARIQISDRSAVSQYLTREGIPSEQLPVIFEFLDRSSKLSISEFVVQSESLGLKPHAILPFAGRHMVDVEARTGTDAVVADVMSAVDAIVQQSPAMTRMMVEIEQLGIEEWCQVDLSIVRGLAYYTGTVFEIHEATGAERAIAGGGRYDKLVELFGGPPMPAVGFAMGDVVLSLVLKDKGLLPDDLVMRPLRPHIFIISAGDDAAEREFRPLVATLRRAGFHVRHSYRSTKNIGKLLGEAGKARALYAVILGRELAEGRIVLKDMDGGSQREVARDEGWASLIADLRAAMRQRDET